MSCVVQSTPDEIAGASRGSDRSAFDPGAEGIRRDRLLAAGGIFDDFWKKNLLLGMQNDPSMESKWNPNDFGFLVTTLVRVSFGWFEEEQINMFV